MALEYPLDAVQNRNFILSMRWRDYLGNAVPVENYGGIMEVRTADSYKLVAKITSTDGQITFGSDDTEETEEADSEQGIITVSVPAEQLKKPKSFECVYEIVLFPNGENLTVDPISFLMGSFNIKRQVVNLE